MKTNNYGFAISKQLSCVILLLVATLSSYATTPPKGNFNLISTIEVKATYLTTDFLKNAYVIDNKNVLTKYDSIGTKIGTYTESKYGKLTAIDATSPFNVLLFYKDYATLVTTDMKLNTRRLFKLPSIGINNVAVACMSHDNYIWVYDMDAAQLKKIDNNYQVVQQSLDLRNILGEAITPNYMVERDGLIYLNIPGMGVIMFDIFGTFYTSVSNTDLNKDDLNSFQVVQQKIVYFADHYLYVYDLNTQEPESVLLPEGMKPRDVRIEKGRLYMLDDDKLQIYAQTT